MVNSDKQGFTLLELIVVIIIIGVLATLGFTQYTLIAEKGRTAEARAILSTVRTAEQAYLLNYGTYMNNLTTLGVSGVPASCDSTHYFSYIIYNIYQGQSTRCPVIGLYAYRCTSGGKSPNYSSSYAIVLCPDTGAWMNDAPY